ncbi:MAG TPA: DUF4870 domain-containing protein [Actinoplanes sp.]|nr:DUF4870 domain-containing protein [Actinoplanes sp.]
MREPPRPPGGGTPPPDPTSPPPYGGDPASGYNPPPPGPPSYDPGPPSSAAGGYPPPSSGAGGYPPGGGTPPPYAAPGYGPPGPGGYGGYSDDDRTWTLLAHFGGAAVMFLSGGWLGWVAPLIVMLVKGNQSPTVRAHAVAALNFQLLWSVVAVAITVVSTCLSVIVIGLLGFFLLFIPWLVGTVFGVIAGLKAANGEPYSYPGAPNWVK